MTFQRERVWLCVSLCAITQNYQMARTLAQGARVIPVLKADAYGLGAARVGRALREAGARLFAVACADEALALRAAVADADILVMGACMPDQTRACVREGIVLTLSTREDAAAASSASLAEGLPARAHIKLDTGLHRLGFAADEAGADEIARACRLPGIQAEGLYSHLALRTRASDEAQFAAFTNARRMLSARGVCPPFFHLTDSIGMTRYPQWALCAVRAGAYLYGNYPDDCPPGVRPAPVARLMCRVTALHDVRMGDCVGYDDAHPLARDSRVATLSAGYVDGLPRAAANRGDALIHGMRARLLGNVCMDQAMCDVTDIIDVRVGDEVTLLGGGITLHEFAQNGGLNRNQATAMIGARVPRLYEEEMP